MNFKLSKLSDWLYCTFPAENYGNSDRVLASKLDLSSTRFELGHKKYHRILTNILSLLLCIAVGITAIAGFSPTALALEYNKEILIEADFSGRDLTDSSFTKANLRQSNFSNSNLRGVSFFAANLESANLQGADLTNATLDSARLIKTNLTNAVLEGAFAASAKFDGAIIDGADFTDALLRQDEQKKLCKLAKGTNPTTGRDTRDSLFCP
ncbi:pentapeptide repeat-containing protein [Anabaena sp. UHCC 0399]|uniref:pentapeptide repeat-containing protein n=1 Tax=Anabaena sp. UHCC 0399 TaxID=3110238 RepID=UPI002B204743|nr:pentapeptide repeat-containing protein [Anabaena sp. UHCC 0399]MEA5563948.1 pentapeptide repeat-containing protein [Anabaena sp. UHCC 0399]